MIVIVEINGKPGCGKTSLLACLACDYMTDNSFDSLYNSIAKIQSWNCSGADFTIPNKHIVYCNIPIQTQTTINYHARRSWGLDTSTFALPNKSFRAQFIPPFAKIFITEAQRYYDSRKSNTKKALKDCISRLFELHRHFHFDIFIDAQRSALIDKNIRTLADEFIYPVKLSHSYDKFNNIKRSIWHCLVFFDCTASDNFFETGDISKNNEKREYVFEGNIYNTYNSFFAENYFLNSRKNDDFDYWVYPELGSNFNEIDEYNKIFGFDFEKNN